MRSIRRRGFNFSVQNVLPTGKVTPTDDGSEKNSRFSHCRAGQNRADGSSSFRHGYTRIDQKKM